MHYKQVMNFRAFYVNCAFRSEKLFKLPLEYLQNKVGRHLQLPKSDYEKKWSRNSQVSLKWNLQSFSLTPNFQVGVIE